MSLKLNPVQLKQDAILFTVTAHGSQQRRGTDEPYVTHPLRVGNMAELLGMSLDAVIAGYLHDVIEDTKVTYAEVKDEFGVTVAKLVSELTILDKHLVKTNKNDLLIHKMSRVMSDDAIVLKLLDRLDNIKDRPTLTYINKTRILIEEVVMLKNKKLTPMMMILCDDILHVCSAFVKKSKKQKNK